MERRELYEPEDIEQLLMERSFDELLPEERAFVLRHLDSAAEYARMRALLLNVAADDADQDVADADPEVRTHLLDVFRQQQRPRYTIWLNSVAAFLVPERPAGRWRPALALGTVAVVITVALLAPWAREAAAPAAMAEVREEHMNDSVPTPAQALQPVSPANGEKVIVAQNGGAEAQDKVDDAVVPMVTADEAAPPDAGATAAGAVTSATDVATAAAEPGEALAKETEELAEERPASAAKVHVVEQVELFSNQSMANEQDGIQATVSLSERRSRQAGKRKKAEAGDVLAAVPPSYLKLLKAAW